MRAQHLRNTLWALIYKEKICCATPAQHSARFVREFSNHGKKERTTMSELAPITPEQQAKTVKNVLAACKDINKLNKAGYGFLCLAPGFIAHYNRFGFKEHYARPGSLREDILAYRFQNQWRNFREGERNCAYYHSKCDVYNAICEKLA